MLNAFMETVACRWLDTGKLLLPVVGWLLKNDLLRLTPDARGTIGANEGALVVRTDILEYLQDEVYSRCKKETNKFGMGCYYHIEAVVKNAEVLAEKYNADKEVVMIAAWLHDIASVTDYALYENHHIHGAEMACEILTKLSYDESKIVIVQNCIRNHRGSVFVDKKNVEELCVADADAISHFDSVPSLLYLAYVERQMNI